MILWGEQTGPHTAEIVRRILSLRRDEDETPHRRSLQLLWLEYKEANPEGLQYSQFCACSRRWCSRLDGVLRQEHKAGDKVFVDFAGQTVPIIDRTTGEVLFDGARREQLHVRAGMSQPGTSGVDQRAHAHDRLLWRRPAGDRARQSEERREPRLLIRAGFESAVSRLGGALRHNGLARSCATSTRQGKGGSGRAAGRAVDTGAATQAHLLLARGTRRRDPPPARFAERKALSEARRQPALAL